MSTKVWAWSRAEHGAMAPQGTHSLGCATMPHGPHIAPSVLPFSRIIYMFKKIVPCLHGAAWAARSRWPNDGWISRLPAFSLKTSATPVWEVGPSHPPGPSHGCWADIRHVWPYSSATSSSNIATIFSSMILIVSLPKYTFDVVNKQSITYIMHAGPYEDIRRGLRTRMGWSNRTFSTLTF